MDIVHKMPSRVCKIKIVEVDLARVCEGGMSHIVTECNRLDQIKIEIERAADRPCNARNKLNVKRTASDIIVLDQRENLRFICISVVIWAMKDLINVMHKRRAPNAPAVLF